MTAFTPNRGYPYSTAGDPADIPAAVQALAEAIDLDVQSLVDSVNPRPFAYVSSNVPFPEAQLFPASVNTEAEFNFVEADNAGISDLSAFPTRLTPTSPGLWMVWGSITVNAGASTLNTSVKDVFLRVNGNDFMRNSFLAQDPSGALTQMTLTGISFMDGVDDYFTLTMNPQNFLTDMRIRIKKMACFRLTTS